MTTPLIRKVFSLELEAPPPDLRDLSLSCHPRSLFVNREGAKRSVSGRFWRFSPAPQCIPHARRSLIARSKAANFFGSSLA
jgi:hypothetical protein